MTKQEALEAMKQGKKVTHDYFTPDEWVTSSEDGRRIYFEDGIIVSANQFWAYRDGKGWEDGYSIYTNRINEHKYK